MADIFPIDLGDSCPPVQFQDVRRFSSQNSQNLAKSRRCSYSYSKSLSWGSNSVDSCYGSSPLTSHSFSAAILFKNSRGQPVIQPLKSPASHMSNIDDDILNFFKCYKVYDLLPTSSKLVVLDTMLSLKKSLLAMVESGVRSCPLWQSSSQSYVGIVSVGDLIKIVQKHCKGSLSKLDELEEVNLHTWLNDNYSPKELHYVSPDSSLYEAINSMICNKVNQLPIIEPDTGNLLFIINQRQLLKFLLNFVPNLQYFEHLLTPILDVAVGTFSNLIFVTKETPLVDAINKFSEHRVSCLPVVDYAGKCVDILCKYDVMQQLASVSSCHGSQITVAMSLEHKQHNFDDVLSCRGDDYVLTVIERLVNCDVSQLVVLDESDQLQGVVTITDILSYLVTVHRQCGAGAPTRVRRGSGVSSVSTRVRQRREDSIGEEVELEEGDSPVEFKQSCSPPRWFDV